MLRKLVPFSVLKESYESSPDWLRALYARIPVGVRMGSAYRRTVREIQAVEYATQESLQDIQSQLLQRLIHHAYDQVPYYRKGMDERGLTPRDISALDSIRLLPLISKREIRDNPSLFTAAGGRREHAFWANTGGSSGEPFHFLLPNSAFPIEVAFILSQWRRVGYTLKERRLTLRGRQVGKSPSELWRYNPMYNELQFSTYDINPGALRKAVPEINRFRPTFLYGYPSAIVLFCKTLREAGLKLPVPIRGALCGSEPLYDYQRQLIQEVLDCRAYSWYGQSERVCLAGECEHSRAYHSFPTYGVLELIDDEGCAIESPGVEGEIVATSLWNYVMPFIRYRTGDRGVFDEFTTCECGRSHRRLKTVVGRSQDYVYTTGRQPIPVTALIFGQHFNAFGAICGMQLHQETPGELQVLIIRNESFREADEEEIREKIESATRGDLRVEFRYVSELKTTEAGKTPFVIQRVDENSPNNPS